MKNNYWQQKWKYNDIGFNQKQPNAFLVEYINTINLKTNDRIFVPLCGKSIDMLWLAEQSLNVVGVELSPIACAAFFTEHSIPFTIAEIHNFTTYQSERITLLSGNFFDLNKDQLGQVNAVYDRAALVALPAELRCQYAACLTNLMDFETKMLLISASYNQNEMEGPPFSVEEKEVKRLYANHFSIIQLDHKSVESIPLHLKAKGLTQISEQVYVLNKFSSGSKSGVCYENT